MTREISIQKKLDDVTTHFKFLINLINEKNSSKKLKKHNKKLMKLFKEIRRNVSKSPTNIQYFYLYNNNVLVCVLGRKA